MEATMDPDRPDLSLVPAATKPATGGQETDVLSPQEIKFVTLSASGESMDSMAGALGLCTRTLRRWKRRPEVASAIAELTHEAMALAKSTLANAANRAARELVGLAESASPDASRVSAARAILEHAEKFVELEELRAEVAELKSRLPAALPSTRFHR
jgi:hypothetical protein